MGDDRRIRGAADRTRINMREDYEVCYWTQKWNVSREQLAAALIRPQTEPDHEDTAQPHDGSHH
jgi:hypothetical protein